MAELKTQPNSKDVMTFLDTIEAEQKRKDALVLLNLFEKITQEPAVMWGSSIIGFGSYTYKNTTGENSWLRTGFSPRKQSLTIYVMQGFDKFEQQVQQLGKTKHAKSCLYINKLSDVDLDLLEQFIRDIHQDMQARYS